MSYWRRRSGFFLQSAHGDKGNFELVVPKSHGEGFVHLWRNNDDGALPWVGPGCFGVGKNSDVSLVQSTFGEVGHLELVANQGGRLVHYWRDDTGPWSWHGPSFFFDGARGAPALVQSFNGDVGNFEVVVGSRDGGLVHVWRDNDAGGLPWRAPTRFGLGLVDGVALIQGNFGEEDAGHLELIVNESGRLAHYFRDDGHSWQWSGANYFADDVPVVGTPALVQSRHGNRGNFELVAAHRDGGLVHIWRDNDSGGFPWRTRTRFGRGAVQSVSLIQSNFGQEDLGNLEVVARQADGRLAHYFRSDQAPWDWQGPFFIGIERAWNMSECTFNWRPAFFQEDARVTVRVQLNFDAGINASTQQSLMALWRTGILSKWDDVFDSVAPNGERRAIRLDIQFVTGNPHKVVRVGTGIATNAGNWDTAATGNDAAHEIGHHIGLADEYTSAACPMRSPIDLTGVMGNQNMPALERHMQPIAGFYCGHLARYRRRWALPPGVGVSMVSLYQDLSDAAKVKFSDHIKLIANGQAGDTHADARVVLVVAGGVPPNRFEHTLALSPSGEVRLLSGNTTDTRKEETSQIDREAAQRVFAAALEMLDVGMHPERGVEPDTPIATLMLSDGDVVRIVNLPLTTEGRGAELPAGFASTGLRFASDPRVTRLAPLLEGLARAAGQTGQ